MSCFSNKKNINSLHVFKTQKKEVRLIFKYTYDNKCFKIYTELYLGLIYNVFILRHGWADDYKNICVPISIQSDRCDWSQCTEKQQRYNKSHNFSNFRIYGCDIYIVRRPTLMMHTEIKHNLQALKKNPSNKIMQK